MFLTRTGSALVLDLRAICDCLSPCLAAGPQSQPRRVCEGNTPGESSALLSLTGKCLLCCTQPCGAPATPAISHRQVFTVLYSALSVRHTPAISHRQVFTVLYSAVCATPLSSLTGKCLLCCTQPCGAPATPAISHRQVFTVYYSAVSVLHIPVISHRQVFAVYYSALSVLHTPVISHRQVFAVYYSALSVRHTPVISHRQVFAVYYSALSVRHTPVILTEFILPT